MKTTDMNRPKLEAATFQERLAVAMHLQVIEQNPLLPDEVAMFERFEREGWSPEERIAFILRQFRGHEDSAEATAPGP